MKQTDEIDKMVKELTLEDIDSLVYFPEDCEIYLNGRRMSSVYLSAYVKKFHYEKVLEALL